jgi:negative regulator of sigma E activity
MNEAIRMQVSAFVDGELPENEAELLVRRLSQDAVLRQQVGEFLAIGRVMRGEYSAQGSNALRERIAAELDERPLQETAYAAPARERARYMRPLAGVAIAASVAVVAIFGLRQNIGPDVDPAAATTAAAQEEFGTVPAATDDDLLPLYLLHTEAAGTQLTSAPLRIDESEPVDDDAESADDADEDEPVTSQP